MSRHRNVRSMNYEDEYYDDEDDYSRSLEDNYCISPGTAAQFTWNRERNMNFASYMGVEDVINEVEVEEDDETEDSSLQDSLNVSQARRNLSDTDQARLNSCLEEIHTILGETVPESVIIEVIIKNQFSVETSLNEILTQKETPKPQRQPRNRKSCSQDDSEDTNKLNELLADIQSLESITKAEYHAPSLLRFKSNPGSDELDSHSEGLDCKAKITTSVDNSASDKTICPSSVLLQKKPPLSLADLAKSSSAKKDNLTKPKVDKVMDSSVSDLSKTLSKEIRVKTLGSGKISLAELAKQSNISRDKKAANHKVNKDVVSDPSISDLSKVLNANLKVNEKGTQKSDLEKISLADLAKQHKPTGGEGFGKKRNFLGPSSSFLSDHKEEKSKLDQKKPSNLNATPTLQSKGNMSGVKVLSSNVSLSELANQHKGGLKKDSKLSTLCANSQSNQPSEPHIPHISTAKVFKQPSKQSNMINSVEKSLAKLSLASCLRSSKQSSGSSVHDKISLDPENLSVLNDAISLDCYKENKVLSPIEAVFDSIDLSLISSPSNSGVVLCQVVRSNFDHRGNSGVKRKANFPNFVCHKQIKKKRILYPEQKLHRLAAFKFSTFSPDDIVKNKQKKAFVRSDKEFSVGY